jgi:aminopeptidase N
MSKQVRAQDTPLLMTSAYGNNPARHQTWEFIQKNWSELLKRYGHGGHLLARFIQPLAAFSTQADYDQIKKFFRKHPHPGADRVVAQTLEEIQSNILWLKRDGENIRKFLGV